MTRTTFEIKQGEFAGPIEKLLELVEVKQLDITRVSLAAVTAEFIGYVQELAERADSRTLADFLVVAAQLTLIKSKVLLPSLALTEGEEREIGTLEDRLRLYREFKQAAALVRGLWRDAPQMASRPLFTHLGGARFFVPPSGIHAADLARAIERALKIFEEAFREPQKARAAVVSVEETIAEVLARLRRGASRMSEMAKDRPRGEVIAIFIALLHLLKSSRIHVEQGEAFGDILFGKFE